MTTTAAVVRRFIQTVAATMKDQRAYLTELDSAIGDADHGINLDRGFSAVVAKIDGLADVDAATLLKTTGMTLVSTVGGASGPLYGTAFLRAATALTGKQELEAQDLVAALEAALEGVQARGRAQRGEKTMIDALGPAIDALKAALERGADVPTALGEAANAAEAGMQATIPMLATKGRASYLGERSIGHQDPGATSACLMIKILRDVVADAGDESLSSTT